MPPPAQVAAPSARGAADDEERFYEVQDDVHAGDHLAIRQRVLALVEDGVPAQEILERGLIAAMDEIGQAFASGEAFIPEVLLSARAMNEAVDALGPHLATGAERHRGRVLVGTVAGDVHDIGKNMVVTMLKGVGFEVQDLGVNVPRARFVAAVAESKPDILGLSALLTTTMMEMRQVIASLEAAGLRDTCRVIVGGAPLNAGFANEIGADGFAEDAVSAVALAKQLVAERRTPPAA
ncbi:MAG: corrinoid protein [Geminicoccaceae bacterium]|nr:corrinoid protein [Geminicoccaceae bacterium]